MVRPKGLGPSLFGRKLATASRGSGSPGRRLLGMTMDGRPIFEPKPCHSLLLSAAGGGKTTCGALPWLQSMLADPKRTIIVTDVKDGEIAAQCADMCAAHGRKVAIIDDFGLFGRLEDGSAHPLRIALNPYGGIIAATISWRTVCKAG